MDLPEKMFLRSVRSGKPLHDPDQGSTVEPLPHFRAKKPEFKELEDKGFVKHHAVLSSRRSDDGEAARKKAAADHKEAMAQWKAADKKTRGKKPKKKEPREAAAGQYQGRKVAVHYWEHPKTGERTKAKIVNPESSPWRSRTDRARKQDN